MSTDSLRLADFPLFGQPPEFVLTKADLVAANPSFVKSEEVDWSLIVLLRRRASERITRELEAHAARTDTTMPETDRRLLGRSVLRRVVHEYADEQSTLGAALWPLETERAYALALENAIFGYGRLQPLFEIPGAENIEIAGCDSVMVQFGDGHREAHPPIADSDEELVEAVRFLGESVRPTRPFDDAHPTMTLALGDRFRLHAIGFGLSFRPSITIRQHLLTTVELADLVDRGMMPEALGRILHASILARKSVVISGDHPADREPLPLGANGS